MSIIHREEGYIWLDGEFVSWQDAHVHALMHTLHYGLGVFEGIRIYETPTGPAIFRLADHTKRLFQSAHILNMPLSISQAELNEVQIEVVRRNELRSGYIRPLMMYSCDHYGLHTHNALKAHVVVATWPWGEYFEKDEEGDIGIAPEDKGIKVRVSSFMRNHVNSALGKAKTTGHYVNSILALQEVNAVGCEEAIMLDTHGLVSEGSSSNIFVVRNGVLYTPPTTSILEGITRETMISLAKELDIPVQEKGITRDEVYIADEVFFTGTAAEVTAVSEVDGRKIGSGARGPITKQLADYYHAIVRGQRDEHRDWLTWVF